MGWLKRRCKHLRVRFHSGKRYLPSTLYAVGHCQDCGKQVEVKIGNALFLTAVQITREVLETKGWVEQGDDVWVKTR